MLSRSSFCLVYIRAAILASDNMWAQQHKLFGRRFYSGKHVSFPNSVITFLFLHSSDSTCKRESMLLWSNTGKFHMSTNQKSTRRSSCSIKQKVFDDEIHILQIKIQSNPLKIFRWIDYLFPLPWQLVAWVLHDDVCYDSNDSYDGARYRAASALPTKYSIFNASSMVEMHTYDEGARWWWSLEGQCATLNEGTNMKMRQMLAAIPNQESSGRDELVAQLPWRMTACFDAVSFRTIRTDINGPFLLFKSYIAVITHD